MVNSLVVFSLLISLAIGGFFLSKRIGKKECESIQQQEVVRVDRAVAKETVRAVSLDDQQLANRLRAYTRSGQAPTVFTPK